MGFVAKTSKGWADFGDVIKAAAAGETIRFGAMSPKIADIAYLLGEAKAWNSTSSRSRAERL